MATSTVRRSSARGGGAAVAVAALLAGACADRAPAPRREALPGFSLELPGGARTGEAAGYAEGSLAVTGLAGGGAVVVVWQPGGLADAGADAVSTVLGRAGVPAQVADTDAVFVVEGAETHSAEVLAWLRRFVATAVPCGARSLLVMTGAVGGASSALHRRVVGSLRCEPDAAEEEALAGPAMAFAPPPGWQPRVAEVGVTGFEGPEGTVRFFALPDEPVPAAIVEGLRAAAGEATAPRLDVAEQHGELEGWRGAAVADGESLELRAVVIPCGERRVAGVYVGQPGFVPARAALSAARCE